MIRNHSTAFPKGNGYVFKTREHVRYIPSQTNRSVSNCNKLAGPAIAAPGVLEMARMLYEISDVRAWFPDLNPEMETVEDFDVVRVVAKGLAEHADKLEADDWERAHDYLRDRLYIDHLDTVMALTNNDPQPRHDPGQIRTFTNLPDNEEDSLENSSSQDAPLRGEAPSKQSDSAPKGGSRQRKGRPTPTNSSLRGAKKREQQTIQKMCEIIEAHKWFGMMTLRFPTSFKIHDESDIVRKICHMLTDRFRADGLEIGLLIKREFGKRPRRALHYHIIFTSQTISDLPEDTLRRLEKAWLRSVKKPNNQSRCFDWTAPHDGEYLKKQKKRGHNVVSIPRSHSNIKLSSHLFHTRGLGRNGGLKGADPQRSQNIPFPTSCNQSEPHTCYLDTSNNTPYWSPEPPSISKGATSQEPVTDQKTDSCSDLTHSHDQVFTQNRSEETDSDFTRSDSVFHTKSAPKSMGDFTQIEPQQKCQTCENNGRLTLVVTGNPMCHECGNPWDICCPF